MIVGTSNNHYPEQRNILVNPENRYQNLKKWNIFGYLNPFRQRLFGKNKSFVFMPVPFSVPRNVDVIHVFNEVAITPAKWIATFETELPRVLPVPGVAKQASPELRRLIPELLRPNCLGLIAISEATWHIQSKLFSHLPAVRQEIEAKTVVMHPPQVLHCQQKPPRSSDKLRFIFAGNEFYRKGGSEVVAAFSQLIAEGRIDAAQVAVTLIGDLSKRHNVAHRQWQDEESWYQQTEQAILRQPVFSHQTALNNSELLALFRAADVGLLPTWQETYGFSVLEMQACGCPVIASNVRALPEINPQDAGWTVAAALNDDREYQITSASDKLQLREVMIAQLKTVITDIVENPAQLPAKSAAAIQRIRQHHDPQRYALKLNEIYHRGIVASELNANHQYPLPELSQLS